MTLDHQYFSELWGGSEPTNEHAPGFWDNRADDWAMLLSGDTAFRRSLDERTSQAASYLRAHSLLSAGSNVADIGCGPGRFVAEFAKTAGHVLGIDISEKMIEHSKSYARATGLCNTSYHAGDFKAVDIEALGWVHKFDLVFSSITGAIGTMDALYKAMRMSRGWCFNSSFVRSFDELQTKLSRELFSIEPASKPIYDGRWFYALFNLLWLEGYYPEVAYHKQNRRELVPIDDELIRYFTRIFSADHNENEEQTKEMIGNYLRANANSDGLIERYTESWYGFVLWNTKRDGNSYAGGAH